MLTLKRERGVQAHEVAIPLQTEPGQEAQVDFGSVGHLYDPAEGRLRKVYVFVMVLSYSRHLFARICFGRKVETWLRLHVEAFEHFQGAAAIVVPDNLKSAVIQAAFTPSEPTTLNRSYRELARHYKFRIAPTPPRSPEKKVARLSSCRRQRRLRDWPSLSTTWAGTGSRTHPASCRRPGAERVAPSHARDLSTQLRASSLSDVSR